MQPATHAESYVAKHFQPKRAASWWSVAEDLLWPEKRIGDKIQRRADALAAAKVDTVIHFGFHCRFDFAWHFGALHGYLADVAAALHERGLKFLDHYSCNVIIRPNAEEERRKYHFFQRHHVSLYPDALAAETAGYAGYRFKDLCQTVIDTGDRAYLPLYQAEIFCFNNPDFRTMYAAYLKRQLAEIPLDGLQQDDMMFYTYFRGCGCRHCRDRFRREYGHELPPLSEKSFWGDTSGHPTQWGNYDSAPFRDWVRMRYRTTTDHLRLTRQILGPDRMLMTCCACHGQSHENSMGISYENFIEVCDWVMLENNGLSPAVTLPWQNKELTTMMCKAIARTRSPDTPVVVASYALYEGGAYLGWAMARFWGVTNWISTLLQGIVEDPPDGKEEAELVATYNKWEQQYPGTDVGADVVEIRLAFLRANMVNSPPAKDADDFFARLHYARIYSWVLAFLERNIGYRVVLSSEFGDPANSLSESGPLVLDRCAYLSDEESDYIQKAIRQGKPVWVVPPLGTHAPGGGRRRRSLLEALLDDKGIGNNLILLEPLKEKESLARLISAKTLSPRIQVIGANRDWRIRMRQTSRGLTLHLLNTALDGVAHPTVRDDWHEGTPVLKDIGSKASDQPLTCIVDLAGMETSAWSNPFLVSPELVAPRPVKVERLESDRLRLTIGLNDVRLYAMVAEG